MNCKIGLLSFVMFSSIIILFLTVPEKVEAGELHCLDHPCTDNCPAVCIMSGYKTGRCAPDSKYPEILWCCCSF
ncbi:hypothetical protein Bca4012_038503 [Brassica carinata]